MGKTSRLLESGKKALRRAKRTFVGLSCLGNARYCPVCQRTSGRFLPYGAVPRKDALCFHCGALERHRLMWLFMQMRTDLFDGVPKRMLHVAPERCFEPRLRERLGPGYLTADLVKPVAMVKMDVTDIQFPDGEFDVICCSHVLEHVQDDRRAMREFHRVLKDDGWAMLIAPVVNRNEKTFEDALITDPKERLRVFGQEDHVRIYGRDYVDRLEEAGFAVEVARPADLVDEKAIARMGLTPSSGKVYFCTKA